MRIKSNPLLRRCELGEKQSCRNSNYATRKILHLRPPAGSILDWNYAPVYFSGNHFSIGDCHEAFDSVSSCHSRCCSHDLARTIAVQFSGSLVSEGANAGAERRSCGGYRRRKDLCPWRLSLRPGCSDT